MEVAARYAVCTRDAVQRLLVGEPKDQSQWGTGLIPGGSWLIWQNGRESRMHSTA